MGSSWCLWSGVSGPHIVTPTSCSSASHCCLITFVRVPPFQVVFSSCQRSRPLWTSHVHFHKHRGSFTRSPSLPGEPGQRSGEEHSVSSGLNGSVWRVQWMFRSEGGLKRGIPLMWLVGGIITILQKNRQTVAAELKILAHVAS